MKKITKKEENLDKLMKVVNYELGLSFSSDGKKVSFCVDNVDIEVTPTKEGIKLKAELLCILRNGTVEINFFSYCYDDYMKQIKDFAKTLTGLFSRSNTINDLYHLTDKYLLPWKTVQEEFGNIADNPNIFCQIGNTAIYSKDLKELIPSFEQSQKNHFKNKIKCCSGESYKYFLLYVSTGFYLKNASKKFNKFLEVANIII